MEYPNQTPAWVLHLFRLEPLASAGTVRITRKGNRPVASTGLTAVAGPRHVRAMIGILLAVILATFAGGALVETVQSPRYGVRVPRVAAPAVLLATAGDARVGATLAAVPPNAIFVSPRGWDSAKGTQTSPCRSLTHAIATAVTGSTIVLRSGSYHESVRIPSGKRLTVQAYPDETVWMDGSSVVTGWTSDGGVWRRDGWSSRFDASPTFTKEAPDGTSPGWRWIDPSHPLAAHPDAVWVNGVQLRAVVSRAAVRPGRFYVDYATRKLYIGSNPHGKEVRASTLAQALYVSGSGSILRGLGVRRYATSVPLMGTVVVTGPRVQLIDMTVAQNASTGIGVFAADVSLRHVTVTKSGLLGVGANQADRLLLDHVSATANNSHLFNQAPVSGGVKITRSRGVTIRDSNLSDNGGPGLWTDQSVYGLHLSSTRLEDNKGYGAFLEISSTMVVAGNLIVNNVKDGLKVNNTTDVQIWNNTFVGNGRSLNIVQDSRLASDRSVPGHDWRRPFPDPTMSWLLGTVVIANNVIAAQNGGANCMMCVEDYTHIRSAGQIGVTSDGNLYNRPSVRRPVWLALWARSHTVDPYVFTSLRTYSSTTGQDVHSTSIDGSSAVTASFALTASARRTATGTARAVPGSIASLIGVRDGARVLGYQP